MSEVAQSCPTLCDPMDCSLPGSSVHGIFQARVLEWVAISFSRTATQTFVSVSTCTWASLVAQRVKRLPEMRETWVQSLGQEDPLEKDKATHSGTLAWKIPWTEKPGRLQSMGSQRATSLSLSFYLHLVKKSSSTDAQLGLLPMLEHAVHSVRRQVYTVDLKIKGIASNLNSYQTHTNISIPSR